MEVEIEFDVTKGNQHLIGIMMKFVSPCDNPVLEMPSWTPGSYLIRDYARHVQDMTITTETKKEIDVIKISKNNWQINITKNSSLIIKYHVYAFDLTVRTSYLDDRKALLTPSSLCMYIVDPVSEKNYKDVKFKISIVKPTAWSTYSSLLQGGDDYFVSSFDELVDTPIAIATEELIYFYEYEFDDSKKKIPCQVVIIGDRDDINFNKFNSALVTIQEECVKMFGELPYDRYVWLLYIVGKGGGGLEHKYSNCSIISRWAFIDEKIFDNLLALEVHEHFHAYNVKRIRPKQLGPFDYSKEVYVKILWVAEGLTNFYNDVHLVRSGLITQEKYWEKIANNLKRLFNQPGRLVTSMEEASFDAWIKLYKPDENSINSTISYYLKGGIIGLMLDIEIRRLSGNKSNLDTFFVNLYSKYQEDRSFTFDEAEIQDLIEKSTGADLNQFWRKYISGTDDIEINEYLNYLGMELKIISKKKLRYTGINFKDKAMKISSVVSGSPAMSANIFARDEIISLNGFRATQKLYNLLLKDHTIEKIEIGLFRDDKLVFVDLLLEGYLYDKYEIQKLENINDDMITNLELFLKTN